MLEGFTDDVRSMAKLAVAVGVAIEIPNRPVVFKSLITDAEPTSNTFESSLQHVLPSELQQYLVPPQGTRRLYVPAESIMAVSFGNNHVSIQFTSASAVLETFITLPCLVCARAAKHVFVASA